MLGFRTLLLWLAFILIILQQFVDVQTGIAVGMAYRLTPSALLLLWFIISLIDRNKYVINTRRIPAFVSGAFRLLRPLSSITIISGAIFKLLHLPGGNLLLFAGIFLMSFYSTLLYFYARETGRYNPNILDDDENTD